MWPMHINTLTFPKRLHGISRRGKLDYKKTASYGTCSLWLLLLLVLYAYFQQDLLSYAHNKKYNSLHGIKPLNNIYVFTRYTLSGKNCRRCVALRQSFLHTRTRRLPQYNMPMNSHTIYSTYKFCFCAIYLPVRLSTLSPLHLRAISISGTVLVLFISGNELKDFRSPLYQIFRRVP